ncbi:hypothetical protein LZ31DRAFT_632713 [Colletotrichum somersetense]|nr:hypothetical protein LZ31DRAFT_632713 [Colletotrichum somersetense]
MLRSCLVMATVAYEDGHLKTQQELFQVILSNDYLASKNIMDDTNSDTKQKLAALGMFQFQMYPQPVKYTERAPLKSTKIKVSMQHALFDGWSFRLIMQELEKCYLGKPVTPLPPFRRFIEYLDRQNVGKEREEEANFWKKKLLGSVVTNLVTWPAGHEPVTDATVSFVSEQPFCFTWPGQTYEPDSAKTMATVTSATLAQTAWAILMGAYANTDDVLFGVVTSGRDTPVPGVIDMAGPTMAIVPSRVIALLYQHSGILRICRDFAGMTDVPSVLLVVQSVNMNVVGFTVGLEQGHKNENGDSDVSYYHWRVVSHLDRVHPYALVVECWIPSCRDFSGLKLMAHHDSSLITGSQASRVLEQFCHIIMSLNSLIGNKPLSDSVLRIGDVAIASPSDIMFLRRLNATIPPSTERCLHELFVDSRKAYPTSIAVDGWDVKFTYAALDELSDRFAQRLMSYGVQAESKVLVFSPKSAWVVVALLAVLKAGGAFVTLEPTHPDSRLQDVIRISGASVALADPSLIQRLEGLTQSESKRRGAMDRERFAQHHPELPLATSRTSYSQAVLREFLKEWRFNTEPFARVSPPERVKTP